MILDYISKEEVLVQLAEEASELAQAALKLRRALYDVGNPTPTDAETALHNLVEEFSDVNLCYDVYMLGDEHSEECAAESVRIFTEKFERWEKRLKANKEENMHD